MRAHIKRWAGRLLFALCWIALAPLAFIACARILRLETTQLVIILEVLIPYALLPAYAVFAVAIAGRRRALGGAAAALVLCHVLWVLPQLNRDNSYKGASTNGTHLKIFSHNVRFDNETPLMLGEAMAKANADVVFIQELSFQDLAALRDLGALQPYQFQFLAPAERSTGMGMFSKLPFRDTTIIVNPGFPGMTAKVDIDGKVLTLVNVHIQSPVQSDESFWLDDLKKLRSDLAKVSTPAIAVGDFNSTWSHRPFRGLLHNGWRDAHMASGRGYARTWPVDVNYGLAFGGLIRLDHVLMSPRVDIKDIEEGPGEGSDHRSVTADLIIY